jgi:pyruvate,orthophosphate dikinase
MTMTQYVYRFGGGVSDGGKGDKNLLGGKGANLDGMAGSACRCPRASPSDRECARAIMTKAALPDSLKAEVATGIAHIEGVTGKKFGDAPIRCSSRSARARAPRCRA